MLRAGVVGTFGVLVQYRLANQIIWPINFLIYMKFRQDFPY
jgi:cell shape-determining protein MreD